MQCSNTVSRRLGHMGLGAMIVAPSEAHHLLCRMPLNDAFRSFWLVNTIWNDLLTLLCAPTNSIV